MIDVIVNKDSKINSLQISKLGDIPQGEEFKLENGAYFLIKNTTNEDIYLDVKMASGRKNEYVNTVFYSGWNVELVKEIKNVPTTGLQYGY